MVIAICEHCGKMVERSIENPSQYYFLIHSDDKGSIAHSLTVALPLYGKPVESLGVKEVTNASRSMSRRNGHTILITLFKSQRLTPRVLKN